jgi:uncharacterized protein (TIGR02246 family)
MRKTLVKKYFQNNGEEEAMKLTRKEIKQQLADWYKAWDRHDLDQVMTFFHEDVFFENWTGAYVKGKENLRSAWQSWFDNHRHPLHL